MLLPLQMNFDLGSNGVPADGIVHLLKIYQDAPYVQILQVKNADNTYTRDFSGYDRMLLQARKRQDSPVLFELDSQDNHLRGTSTQLEINFPASVTRDLKLDRAGTGASETSFVYDLVFIEAGVVVERFAQGTGIIVASTTRAT